MIPRVRKWRVALRDPSGRMLASVIVDAPNKRFAKWHARDAFGYAAWHDSCSVSVTAICRKCGSAHVPNCRLTPREAYEARQ